MKLQIKITKDVLRRSMWCGTKDAPETIGYSNSSCAIALAIRDIFPDASIERGWICPFGRVHEARIYHNQNNFTYAFDELHDTPEKRLDLPEFSFTISIPTEVIDTINIDDIYTSKTLEVVS